PWSVKMVGCGPSPRGSKIAWMRCMICFLASQMHCVLLYLSCFQRRSKCFFHRDTVWACVAESLLTCYTVCGCRTACSRSLHTPLVYRGRYVGTADIATTPGTEPGCEFGGFLPLYQPRAQLVTV